MPGCRQARDEIMRWIPLVVILYGAAVLQTTVVPLIEINGIRPDLLVVIAVFYALYAPRYDAMLTCWCVGLLMDLTSVSFQTHSNVGVHALAMGLVGILVVALRDYTVQDSPLTQMLYCLAARLLIVAIAVTHLVIVLDVDSVWRRFLAIGIWEAIYTGLLAPYAFWLLRKLRGTLGLGPSRQYGYG